MKIRVISVLVLLLLLFVPIAVAQQGAPEPDFDQYVVQAMKEWEVPGLAIAVVKDDRIVFAKGYGLRELGGTAAVNEHTLFAIRSEERRVGKEGGAEGTAEPASKDGGRVDQD